MSLSRRTFLGSLSAGLTALSSARAQPHGETIRVGVIGTGVRGKYLIGNLPDSVRVSALCDSMNQRMAETLQPRGEFKAILARFAEADARRCATYQDYRRLFDREKLDAVIIATPDHHHVLPALLALRSGMHVYLEKPLTVSIREGRILADAVRKSGRVLQVGSQQRTMEINRFACDFIRRGGLGRITRVDLPNYPGPLPMPDLEEEKVPSGLDWNMFCGPTELRPHHRRLWVKDEFRVGELLWRGWDYYRDYSGHLMTNWGAHSIDMVQLALGRDDTGPVEVRISEPASLEAAWKPWANKTPAPAKDESDRRFWPVTMRYRDGVELRFVHGPDFIVFHGEKGRLRMRRNFFDTDPPDLVKDAPDAKVAEAWRGAGHVARPHLENWLDCIHHRREVHAPVEAGHRTATICHLANLARHLGRPLHWDPAAEQFVKDAQADHLLDRPQRLGFGLPQT
jgi:predicted dehydrogenase